jgi:hypothetical protein
MRRVVLGVSYISLALACFAGSIKPVPDDGYRGIWYYNQPTKDEYRYKYSGGMATYPQQHIPIAVYCSKVRRTFFVYGGTTARTPGEKQRLLHMVSYYDHKTGLVPRPLVLLDKGTDDAHDNPVLQVDGGGHVWVFSPSHGTGRPSFIHRSTRPWDITEFELISSSNFSYPQVWQVPGQGFLFLHTRYGGGKAAGVPAARALFCMSSKDGKDWGPPALLAGIFQGDYQVSWASGTRVATAFDCHPPPGGLNARANVYYLQTEDLGRTWKNVAGETIGSPVTNAANPALVYDSWKEGLLVYLKDINFDAHQRPIILFLTSKGFEPGPENGPRQWRTLQWTGMEWLNRPITTSGNNYDHGSLYVESDGTWRVIAPTDPGPQPYNPGGEMVMWTSRNEGGSWQKVRVLTGGSTKNHTYARRPVDASPEFYALWADGDARKPSDSSLYFATREGRVFRLPRLVEGESSPPTPVEPH